jgi:hypothetical protein
MSAYLNAGILNYLCLVTLWESGETCRTFLRKKSIQMRKPGTLIVIEFNKYIRYLGGISGFAAYVNYWVKTKYQVTILKINL